MGAVVHLKPVDIKPIGWEKPLDVFTQAYKLECEYREHLDRLAKLARAEGDELTVNVVVKLLDDQVESCNEFEVYTNKAKLYSAMAGLLYHLDHELAKKAKK
jgi:ferritin